MNHELELMKRNGRMVVNLAREFLGLKEGQRLIPISNYADRYKVARGTVQSAMRYLNDIGAARLQSKGHMGTFITSINYQKLWEVSGLGSVLGLMPLPYTKRYEGLATGLFEAFDNANLPFNLAFMRGANNRLEMLANKVYHFAITSKLAVIDAERKDFKFKIVHEFPEESYVTKHGVILRKGIKKLKDGIKVALDESSPDQSLLTQKECQNLNVEFVPMSYNQITESLEAGIVDAAVWNIEELQKQHTTGTVIELQNEEAKELDRDGSRAVMVVDYFNGNIGEVISMLVDFLKIEEAQSLVISDKKIPMY